MFNISKEQPPIFDNPLRKLSKDTNISSNEILNNLMNGKDNLALKSHIFKPKALAGLRSLQDYLELHNYTISSTIIKNFIRTYLEYMVSYKRLSRTEIIKAFTYSNRIESKDDLINID